MPTPSLASVNTCTPKTGLDAAAVLADPPAKANMVALATVKPAGARYVEAVIDGEDATARALTGAWWFGWHAKLDKAVPLAPVAGGYDVSVSTTKAHRDVLEFVGGLYTHLGVGKGTLAASTIGLHVFELEAQED